MKYIVIDIEAENMVADWSKPWEAGLSVCCAWISWQDKFRFFDYHNLDKLGQLVDKADTLISYNGRGYDYPVLCHFEPRLKIVNDVDLCGLLKAETGRRHRLENVARATLGAGKSGHGKCAPEQWKRREYADLYNYCLDDVAITRDLYLFVREHGFLVVPTDTGGRQIVELRDLARPGKLFQSQKPSGPATPRQLAKLKHLTGREWPNTLTSERASQEIQHHQRLEF